MQIIKTIVFISGLMIFSGCSSKTIDINTIESERVKLKLSEPNQIELKEVNFYIITDKNSQNVFTQLKTANKDSVLFGLTDDDYIKMSENILELKQYIIKQRQIIKSYKEYYESDDKN